MIVIIKKKLYIYRNETICKLYIVLSGISVYLNKIIKIRRIYNDEMLKFIEIINKENDWYIKTCFISKKRKKSNQSKQIELLNCLMENKC